MGKIPSYTFIFLNLLTVFLYCADIGSDGLYFILIILSLAPHHIFAWMGIEITQITRSMNEQNKAYAFVKVLGNALSVIWWIVGLVLLFMYKTVLFIWWSFLLAWFMNYRVLR